MDNPESAPDDRTREQFSSSDRAATSTSARGISRLAVIAFLLSLVGVFVSAGLAAIALSIVSLRRIRRSGNVVKGRLIAFGAIALSIVMVPLPALVNEVDRVHALSPEEACTVNLARLGQAMLIYANDHDDHLPTPSQWCDLLMSTGAVDWNSFQCPGTYENPWSFVYPLELYLYLRHKSVRQRKGLCTYAMNEYRPEVRTSASPDTVLLFDARPGWNQTGGRNAAVTSNHPGRGCNVLFMDMHMESVGSHELDQLTWKPSP